MNILFPNCPFIFSSYCIVDLNVLFLGSPEQLDRLLAAIRKAAAASANLCPPRRKAEMKHLLLRNQTLAITIS